MPIHNQDAHGPMFNSKEILCENIPELFLDKLTARQHFSQFGNVTRVILRPRRLSCTVAFESEAEARRAFANGGNYHGHKFTIRFAPEEERHVQNTEEWVNADVQAELEAISNVRRSDSQYSHQRGSRFSMSSTTPAHTALTTVAPATKKAAPEQSRSMDNSLRNDLMFVMKRPAYTTEEKYRVLDARDKMMRGSRMRRQDIDKLKVTKGFCPDMCPEKERLLREFQRQVSTFEADEMHTDTDRDVKISHKYAIKEYSRSSADQETPLAHELRSEEALGMTMAYLLHRIVDLCDNPQISPGDWFHFVWDRLRAIRKEITQQELCSLNVVRLVEQCARFHIHCRARLVAEDPSVFDKKINADNLQKCLQSLKYMYHDLRLDNIDCPYEPEFWSYVILLNLANSNFVWEINQLPEYIQQSPEVKRATYFFYALQDNNYVRFFQMVREPETTYLMACILLGYFQEMRLRALEIMTKAHKGPKGVPTLPLAHITHLLAFENEQNAAEFLEYHGISVQNERVYLEPPTKPESEYKMERAKQLVESKRLVSVGECICGNQLPPEEIFELHEPHNSFDENGMLKAEAWYAEDQLQSQCEKDSTQSDEPLPDEPVNASKPTNYNDAIQLPKTSPVAVASSNSVTDGVFKVPRCSPPISPKQNFFKQPQQQQQQQQQQVSAFATSGFMSNIKMPTPGLSSQPTSFSGNIFDLKLPPTTGSIFSTTNKNQNIFKQSDYFMPQNSTSGELNAKLDSADQFAEKEKHAKEEAERQERLRAEKELRDRLEIEMRERREAAAAEEERKRVLIAQRRAERDAALNRKAMQIFEHEFWNVLLPQQIAELAHETYEHAHRQQCSKEALTKIIYEALINQEIENVIVEQFSEKHYALKLLRQCFHGWLAYTRRRQHQRQVYESMACWMPTETLCQQAEHLLSKALKERIHNDQTHNGTLNMMRRYRQGRPADFSALLKSSNRKVSLPHETLDMWQLLARKLPSLKLGARKYCKLIFTLPSDTDELLGFASLCNKWFKRHLVLHQNLATPHNAYINALANNVALCVRKISGTNPPLDEHETPATDAELSHSDGIVCFMTPASLTKTRERLRQISRDGANIAFVVFDSEHVNAATLETQLAPSTFGCQRYAFFGCEQKKSQFNFTKMLGFAIEFLAQQLHENKDAQLEQQSLIAFVERHLGTELWNRWHYSAAHNPAFKKAVSQNCDNIVGLYNEAVARLQQIVAEDFQHVRRFPDELRAFVPKELITLDMPLSREYFIDGWHKPAQQRQIVQLLEHSKLPKIKTFVVPHTSAELENALYLWLLDYGSVCLLNNEEQAVRAVYECIHILAKQMNHSDLLNVPLDVRLQHVDYLDIIKVFAMEHLRVVLQNENYPKAVVYRRQSLISYCERPWWLHFEPVTNCVLPIHDASNDNNTNATSDSSSIDECNDTATALIPIIEFGDIVKRAETATRRTYQSRSVHKYKPLTPANFNKLTRNLDESIMQFELCDHENLYETCSIEDNASGDQKRLKTRHVSVDENGGHIPRNYKNDNPPTLNKNNLKSSIDEAIERARNLISRLDKLDDDNMRFQNMTP